MFFKKSPPVPLTVDGIKERLDRGFGKELRELQLEALGDGVRVCRIKFRKNTFSITNIDVVTREDLERLIQHMGMLYDLSGGPEEPKAPRKPREIRLLDDLCFNCESDPLFGEYAGDYVWVLPAGHRLVCEGCCEEFAVFEEDYDIYVDNNGRTHCAPSTQRKLKEKESDR